MLKTEILGSVLSRHFCLAVVLLSTCLSSFADGTPQPTLQTVLLSINEKQLKTEIANTPNQRYMGLSFRKTLAQNEAMLFVYKNEQPLVFTMRNTLLPLSIAFISKDFIINEIIDMPVGPGQNFPSQQPAQYALEVNQGWFERNGISVGTQIRMN